MKYFFVESLKKLASPSVVRIGGSDARHIKNVLRLGPGDIIGLFDGTGAEYEARINALSKTDVEVAIIQKFTRKSISPVHIDIGQALLKDKKMDGLIRQLTELGVTRFRPFISHRSVPRPDKKRLLSRVERWNKISKESLKQCRRGYVMGINEVVSFETLLGDIDTSDLKIAFWEEATESIQSIIDCKHNETLTNIFAILGPEGGFTSEEMAMAKEAGFLTASLGPRILRSETAAVSTSALLQYLFGDMS
jgi:16S rRNA (uracil1498-N3)-methyltransferase